MEISGSRGSGSRCWTAVPSAVQWSNNMGMLHL